METPRAELDLILDWTNEKLGQGSHTPLGWYQLMKLRDAVEAILARETALPSSVPQREQHRDHLRLVKATDPDSTQR